MDLTGKEGHGSINDPAQEPGKNGKRIMMMRILIGYTGLLISLLVSQTALARDVKLVSNQFQESYINEVQISGAVRAGVMFDSKIQHVAPQELYIDLGDNDGAMLSVKMISIDGRYEAGFDYLLGSGVTGLTRFDIPTKMANILSRFSPGQLAVLARLKYKDRAKPIIVPATWGKPESKEIRIFLNSGVSQTLLKLYHKGGGSQKLVCKKIDTTTGTAYDTECVVEDYTPFDMKKTKIIRKNFDSFFKPLKLNIQCD